MSERLKIGLIGCGRIAQIYHLRALERLERAQLVAIAEPDPNRLAEARRIAPGAAPFDGLETLLARADVEAVVICLPTHLHASASIAAFEAGKHVYIEKPIATGLGEGRGVLEAWRATGKVGMIGFNYRFHPLYRTARRQLRDGRIGRVVAARSAFCAAGRSLPDWKRSRQTGGGALLDLATHHADLARFLLGREVATVHASLRSVRSEADTATLELRLDDGTPVQTFVSMAAVEEDRFEFYGEDGKLVVDRYRSRDLEHRLPSRSFSKAARLMAGLNTLVKETPGRLRDSLFPANAAGTFRDSLAEFVDAVLESRPPAVDLLDGYKSLAIVEAAEISAREGRPATVEALDFDANEAAQVGASTS